MLQGYSKGLPRDQYGGLVQLMPPFVALEETYDTTVSTSTEITLNAATTMIEVTALTQPIFMKWGTADVTSTDWDHVIPAGMTRQFVVPIEQSTGILYTAVNFIEQAASATLCMSEF